MARYPRTSFWQYDDLYARARYWHSGCPVCHATGSYHGTWIEAHLFHERARCGRMVTRRGLRNHERLCSHCRDRPVPEGITIEPQFTEETPCRPTTPPMKPPPPKPMSPDWKKLLL